MSTLQSKIEKKCEVDVTEHIGNLSLNLNSARKERRLCDFVINVGTKKFHVHKIVLSEGSDYYRRMFSHRMKETETGVADMKDLDPDCMEICIEYIYTGKVTVPLSMVHPLLLAAHLLQLTGLYNSLANFLDENLDAESYFLANELAKKFGLSELEERCDQYATENFEMISQQDGFKSIDAKALLSLVSNERNQAQEGVKLKSILKWIQADAEARKKLLHDVHNVIDFAKIPLHYRRKLIEDEPLVLKCSELLQRISLSVMDALSVKAGELSTHNQDIGALSANSGDLLTKSQYSDIVVSPPAMVAGMLR